VGTRELKSEDFNTILYYDEASKSCLRWSVDRPFGNGMFNARAGDDAGNYDEGAGYYKLTLNGITYQAHRIVYCLLNGSVPADAKVDHEDGNGANNRGSNLRIVTTAVNCRNSKARRNNSSGIHGVGRYTPKAGSPYWIAQWLDLEGKHKSKTFSISKYGEGEAKRLAIDSRTKAIAQLNSEGAGYTERHGTCLKHDSSQ